VRAFHDNEYRSALAARRREASQAVARGKGLRTVIISTAYAGTIPGSAGGRD
jgi:hypothetical protein